MGCVTLIMSCDSPMECEVVTTAPACDIKRFLEVRVAPCHPPGSSTSDPTALICQEAARVASQSSPSPASSPQSSESPPEEKVESEG